MSSNADKPSSPDSPGSAADELTPPTMKFASQASSSPSGTENTIKVTGVMAGDKTMPTTARTQASRTVSNITGDFTETLSAGIETQDLVNDPLLLAAPRVDYKGKQVPCLNGIPMLAMIGRGGMGAVYYGVHPRLRSEVAVKVLPFHLAEQDQGMIRRFFREAQIAAQVRSPHLVNVMDVNEEAGLFFLVMEFVPGRTAGQYLKACLEKGTPVTEANTLDLVIAATEGLWAAHAAGVIHRDIKPENIMVPYAGRTKDFDLRRAKLMDLGLARSEESNQSLTGNQAAMGTPGYMAPEQAMDAKTADKRSDVLSMGATIYAMMYGKPPFRGETVMKILMATMHEPHEPLIKVRPDVSPVLNEIVERCLAKKQEHRFADAKQLLNALEECKRLGASGNSGSIPTPGSFVYRPESGPTPGSSTNATQMGLPTNTGTPVAKKGGKGMLLVGGGVAAALAAGIAIFALSGPGTPKMSAEQRKLAVIRFDNETKIMNDIFDKPIDQQVAEFSTLNAVVSGLPNFDIVKVDEEYKKKADDYARKVQGIANYTELQKKVNVLLSLLNAQKIDEYKKLLPEAEKLAIDETTQKLLEGPRKEALKLQTSLDMERRGKEALTKTRKAVGEGNLEVAQQEYADLEKLLPKSADLPVLKKAIVDLEEKAARKTEVAKLNADLRQKQEAGDWVAVGEIAQQLVAKDPGNSATYAKLLTESSAKQSDEQRKKQAEARTQQIASLLTEATTAQKKGDLDKAERALNSVEALDPGNAAAKALKETVANALIAQEREITQRRQRASADEYFTKAQKQLDDPNGDMTFALSQLELGRKEITTDLEYGKKADALAAAIEKKAQQQKNLREADEKVSKAGLLRTEKNLTKLREGEDLARQALELVPDHPGAKTALTSFGKLIADKLKELERDKETHNTMIADGEKLLKSATGKSLAEQLQAFESAQRLFDDAKNMQPDSPGSKLSAETATKVKAIREQLATEKKIAGIVATADGLAARGSFDDAVKALDALQALDKDLFKKKGDDYVGRKAKAEQLIAGEIQKIATKASSPGMLGSALADAQTLYNSNSTRTELGQIVNALGEASRIERAVNDDLANFKTRVANKTARLKGNGAAQLAAAEAQINAYAVLVPSRVKAFADGGFKDAAFAQTLASDQRTQRTSTSSAVDSYDYVPEPVQEVKRPRDPDPVPEVPGNKKEEKKPPRRRSGDDPGLDGIGR